MATVIPFRAFRPADDIAHLVPTRSFIAYTNEELAAKLANNPYSFINIIHPDHDSPNPSTPNTTARFEKIKVNFEQFVENGYLAQDESDHYYIYRQTKEGRSYTGIIACVAADDYIDHNIRLHEDTLAQREKVFATYLSICQINAEPVLITYPDNSQINGATQSVVENDQPLNDYTHANGIRHELWPVNEVAFIDEIKEAFNNVPTLYIADGHHRSASSVRLTKSIRGAAPNHTGQEPFNYFMAYLLPESDLQILEYNRLVKDMGEYSYNEFIDILKEAFEVEKLDTTSFKPTEHYTFGMYMDKSWYKLSIKQKILDKEHISLIDPQVLSDEVLEPILGITDLRTDDRIDFAGGTISTEDMVEIVDSGEAKIAFTLKPISFDQLKSIADTNMVMPPKSTWIEPKLRSGLTIYSLN